MKATDFYETNYKVFDIYIKKLTEVIPFTEKLNIHDEPMLLGVITD